MLQVENLNRGTVLVSAGWVADTMISRMVGLLRHRTLEAGEGLWIKPCNSIHSLGMKFRFDAIFLNAHGRVLFCIEDMAPMRLSRLVWGAVSVLEVPTGTIARTQTRIGDDLTLRV